ncbi:MAG: tetratricopeptide repeat protein [bacterium]
MRKRSQIGPVAIGLVGLCLCACATGQRFLMTRDPLISEAESHFSRGEYRLAQLKYSAYLYSPEPSKPDEALALFRLGHCQYILGHHRDAEQTLSRYVRTFPDDKHRPEAEEWLVEIRTYIQKEERLREQRIHATADEIATLKETTRLDPRNAEKHFELGEAFWKMGQIPEALEAYNKAVRLDPRYRQHPTIQKRAIVHEDGSLELRESLITPKTAGPIRIRNIQTKRVERSDFWGIHPTEYGYVVSGEAVHVGDKTCTNVQIEVTIYDFYEKVMDAKIVNIGTMKPGQRRHFVTNLNRFAGDPLDIRRYETQVFYEEQ